MPFSPSDLVDDFALPDWVRNIVPRLVSQSSTATAEQLLDQLLAINTDWDPRRICAALIEQLRIDVADKEALITKLISAAERRQSLDGLTDHLKSVGQVKQACIKRIEKTWGPAWQKEFGWLEEKVAVNELKLFRAMARPAEMRKMTAQTCADLTKLKRRTLWRASN